MEPGTWSVVIRHEYLTVGRKRQMSLTGMWQKAAHRMSLQSPFKPVPSLLQPDSWFLLSSQPLAILIELLEFPRNVFLNHLCSEEAKLIGFLGICLWSSSLCPTFEEESVSWNPLPSTMPELMSASLDSTESVLHGDVQSGSQPFHSQEPQMLWIIPPEPLRWDRARNPLRCKDQSSSPTCSTHSYIYTPQWLVLSQIPVVTWKKLKTRRVCPSHSMCGSSLVCCNEPVAVKFLPFNLPQKPAWRNSKCCSPIPFWFSKGLGMKISKEGSLQNLLVIGN